MMIATLMKLGCAELLPVRTGVWIVIAEECDRRLRGNFGEHEPEWAVTVRNATDVGTYVKRMAKERDRH